MKICSSLFLCAFLVLRNAELSTSAATGPWTQYLPAQRRAISADEVVNSGQSIPSDVSDGEVSPQASLPYTKLPLTLSYNPLNPYLNIKPFLPVKPTFLPPFVNPQMFIDKKSAILNNLFNSGSASPSPALGPGFWIPASVAATPNYFAQKRTEFLNNLFNQLASQSATPANANAAKRSIAGAGVISPSPWNTVVDPQVFTDKKADFLNKLFASLNAPTEDEDEDTEEDADIMPVKPTIVPPNFWLPFESSQPSLDTKSSAYPQITPFTPFGPFGKAAPVVDPQIFVDKKTAFLNKLFKNIGLPPKPIGVPPTKVPIVPADFWVPPGKLTTTTVYNQKVSEFLDKLFKSLNTTTSPDSESEQNETQIQRRSIGNPFAPAPVVDPAIFADKKAAFLSKLFANLNDPTQYDAGIAPLKPTIVPPNFWSPFASSQSDVEPAENGNPFSPVGKRVPADTTTIAGKETKCLHCPFNNLGLPPKPTKSPIVSPNFWIPSGKLTTPTTYDQKVSDFLDKLFHSLSTPTSLQKRHNDDDDDDDDDNIKATEVSDENTEDFTELSNNPSRRNVVLPNINSLQQEPLLAAKDKVVNTIVAELDGIKDNMLQTLIEIVQKQKESAAAAAAAKPTFPFGGPPPGVFKKGGPPPGVGKKGGPPPGTAKKSGGPFGGSYPFWGPPPKPTPDPTEPLQERLEILNQVSEMLTKLHKDVTTAVNQEVTDRLESNSTPPPVSDEAKFATLIAKLLQQQNNTSTNVKKGKKVSSSKPIRAIQTNSSPFLWSSDPSNVEKTLQDEAEARTRSIKMAVHQGYQSLPPGAEELLQAGGGSDPNNHEGGGIKLQIKVPA